MTSEDHDLYPHRRMYGQFIKLTVLSAVGIAVVLGLMALLLL